jgi:hypothetical protein
MVVRSTQLKSWTDTAQPVILGFQLVFLGFVNRLSNQLTDTFFQHAANHALVLASIALHPHSMAA